ncbi:MAG: hypothetical protein AAF989_00705 [Planctomycetota bacterium]
MSRNPSESPSVIVMLAPVAIVLSVYSFAFLSPQQAKVRSTQAQYDTLSKTHHESVHEIERIRFQLGQLNKETRDVDALVEEQQQIHSELATRRSQLRHQLESHSLPAATMQRVTRLMESHRLRVMESQQDSSAAGQAEEALKSIRDLLKDDRSPVQSRFNSRQHSHPAKAGPNHTHFSREIYKLKIRGRFQDLQAALETLSEQLEHVLPLSLQMESIELNSNEARQSLRNWTLTIMV